MAVPDNSYWKSYLQASQRLFDTGLPGAGDEPNASAYADALNAWWSKVSPESPPATKKLFEKLIEQSAAYFQFAEHLKTNGEPTEKDTTENWAHSALGILSQLEKAFSQASTQQPANIDRIKKFIEQPFSAWEGFTHALGNDMPGLQAILSSPAIGINREYQSLLQQYLEKELEYQQVLAEYHQFHNNVGIKSCARLKQALSQPDADQEKTFRAIYNLWVENCEGVYAEEVATDFFSELYGALINAMMSVHQARQKVVDKTFASLGLPTQQHIEELAQSLLGLRRQQKRDRNVIHQLQLRCDQLEKIVSKPVGHAEQAKATTSKRAKTRSRQAKPRAVKISRSKKSTKRTRVKRSK